MRQPDCAGHAVRGRSKTCGCLVTPLLFILAAPCFSVNQLVNQFGNATAGLGIIALGLPAYWFWTGGKAA